MAFEERVLVLEALPKSSIKILGLIVGVATKSIMSEKEKKNVIMTFARSQERIPLEAFDKFERSRLPGYNASLIERWKESERRPAATDLPSREAMTYGQRREAFASLPYNTLQKLAKGMFSGTARNPTKVLMVQHLGKSDVIVPTEAYEAWSRQSRLPNRQDHPVSVRLVPSDYKPWILGNMEQPGQPAFTEFVSNIGANLQDRFKGRRCKCLYLHPRGFETKQHPCVIPNGSGDLLLNVNVNPETDLAKGILALDQNVGVHFHIQLRYPIAEMVVNGDRRGLQQLWGSEDEMLHLCHSKFNSSLQSI